MDDNSEIVFCCALDGQGGCENLSSVDEDETRPVWMHLDITSRNAGTVLTQRGLEPYVVDTMTRHESRPHTVAAADGLMIILRGINYNPKSDPEDMVSIRIWLRGNRLYSARMRHVRAVQLVRKRLEDAGGPQSVTDILIAIIENLADGIAQFIDAIEARVELLETSVEEALSNDRRGEISSVRREVASVRRYLAPQRDALDSLHRLAGKLMDSEQVFALRDQSDRMSRYIEDLDLLRERALVAQEELMNRIAQEQNTRTYLFAVVATVFLPITFLSGVFGMNTAGLPGLENGAAFWIVAAVMAVVSLCTVVWLRLKKWF